MTIADRIRAARKRLGWSQKDLAERCETSAMQVAHWEAGRRTPNAASTVKLANALGVTAGWLLGAEE